MFKIVISTLILTASSLLSVAQVADRPVWNVTLEANKTAPSNLTVQNRCQGAHDFKIELEDLSFLQLGKSALSVGGGANEIIPVVFNTSGLASNTYRGNVFVVCLTCPKEPGCKQDREILPVVLNVPGVVAVARNRNTPKGQGKKGKSPCDIKCEDLLVAANKKEAKAKALQEAADKVRSAADKARQEAIDADAAAKRAEEAAEDDPSDYRARVNDQKYSSADVAYRLKLQAEINAAQKAGQISNKEHERRTKANTTKKAREERLRNKKKLKKEAKKARAKAKVAKKASEKAKAAADEAQRKADDAKAKAETVRRAYNDCVKKAKEECDKLLAAQAKAAADAKAAEDLRLAEEKRKATAESRRLADLKEKQRLLELIRKLGLIDKKIGDVPSIWGWLPDILETPIATLAEQQTGVPIPTDTIKALGGLYGLIGTMLNPCTKLGKEKTIKRLEKMKNPKTGKNYSFGEALKETDDMCNVLGEIKGKLQAVKSAREKRK